MTASDQAEQGPGPNNSALIRPGISPSEADVLVRYYDRIRQSVAGFDGLVVDILSKGATLVIAILVVPWSLLHFSDGLPEGNDLIVVFKWLSYVSTAAVFASAYVTFAVSLYADLLRRSVYLGIALEKDLLEDSANRGLTTILDDSPLAGGKKGKYLYSVFAMALYAATAVTSVIYFYLGHLYGRIPFCNAMLPAPFWVMSSYFVMGLAILWWNKRSWSSFKGLDMNREASKK